MLTAAREDIDESAAWNVALRNAVVDAFTTSVNRFNSESLQYSWLRYLPVTSVQGFFKPLRKDIIRKLAEQQILESCTGSLLTPSSLKYVPHNLSDDDGIPFSLGSNTKGKYLSHKYRSQDWGGIHALGVEELSFSCFLEDLHSTITNDTYVFRHRSDKWHSKLARALLPGLDNEEHYEYIFNLKIIPLQDGEWVSAQDHMIYFSRDTNNLRIPRGIEVLAVDSAAAADPSRRSLFSGLRVTSFDASEICQMIMDVHSDPDLVCELSPTELFSHAEFLYSAKWQPADNSELWFATDQEGCSKGSLMYMEMDLGPHSSITGFLKHEPARFPFLHRKYLSAFSKERERWLDWLRKHFGLSKLPHLAYPPLGSSFNLSKDFQFVFGACPSAEVLLLLRDNWSHYSKWIEEDTTQYTDSESNRSRAMIRRRLGSMEVKCCDGNKHRLEQTCLPGIDPEVEGSPQLAMLDVPDPSNPKWKVLEILGVAVKKNLRFYFLYLSRMKGSSISIKKASYVYQQLQAIGTTESLR